jgi:hypothetical protein
MSHRLLRVRHFHRPWSCRIAYYGCDTSIVLGRVASPTTGATHREYHSADGATHRREAYATSMPSVSVRISQGSSGIFREIGRCRDADTHTNRLPGPLFEKRHPANCLPTAIPPAEPRRVGKGGPDIVLYAWRMFRRAHHGNDGAAFAHSTEPCDAQAKKRPGGRTAGPKVQKLWTCEVLLANGCQVVAPLGPTVQVSPLLRSALRSRLRPAARLRCSTTAASNVCAGLQ